MPTHTSAQRQREHALARANEIRLARARIRRELAAGTTTLQQALQHPACETARVADLLLAMQFIGPIKLGRILARANLSATRLAGNLSTRQRDSLLEAVAGAHHPRPRRVRTKADTAGVDPDSIEAMLA